MYFFCNYWRLLTKKSFSNIACGLSFSLSHHTQTYTHILLKVDRNQTVSTRQWTNKEINLHIENNRKHNSNNNNLILVTLPPSNSASISMDLFLWSPEDTARTVPHPHQPPFPPSPQQRSEQCQFPNKGPTGESQWTERRKLPGTGDLRWAKRQTDDDGQTTRCLLQCHHNYPPWKELFSYGVSPLCFIHWGYREQSCRYQ